MIVSFERDFLRARYSFCLCQNAWNPGASSAVVTLGLVVDIELAGLVLAHVGSLPARIFESFPGVV